MAASATIPERAGRGSAVRGGHPAIILGTGVFAGLLALGGRLLQDPDTYWHVAVGARIWRDRAVPWTDDYSHTFAGAPWIAKEWLGQLLLAWVHDAAGWRGVVVLTAATLAGVLACLHAWLCRRLRGTAALAVTLVALMGLAPHFLARPLVFGLAALLAWTTGLATSRERDEAPSPWLLVVLALWANLHGSFTFAYPLLALMGAEAVLAAPPARRWATFLAWGRFGVLALVAGCASPYGIHAMGVTATLFGSGESLPFVTEWQPLAMDATGLLTLGSAALVLAVLAAEPRRNLMRGVAVAGITAMTLRHGRFLDVYALVVPVLAAGPIVGRVPALRPDGMAARRGPAAAAAALALAGGVALSCWLVLAREPVLDPAITPAVALAAARSAGAAGPVYNDYDFGGYLIAEGVPTFIDGRTDQLFLDGFISGLYRAVRAAGHEPFLSLLDRHHVGWALVRPSSPEADHLRASPGWRAVGGDAVATAFVRQAPPPP